MTHTLQIVGALKKCLKAKGMTYKQLARALDLSEPSIKRVFSEGSFTLKRLEQICNVLDVDFYELAKMSRTHADAARQLSIEQEMALAKDRKLLTMFHLLLNDYTLKDICALYAFSELEAFRLFNRLDRLGLITLYPRNRAKLRVSKHFSWRPDGPIRALYKSQIVSEFFDAKFAEDSTALTFEAKELSAASLAVIRRKIERLASEFDELAEIDAALPSKERQNVAIVLAIRPWVFSVAKALKRR